MHIPFGNSADAVHWSFRERIASTSDRGLRNSIRGVEPARDLVIMELGLVVKRNRKKGLAVLRYIHTMTASLIFAVEQPVSFLTMVMPVLRSTNVSTQ